MIKLLYYENTSVAAKLTGLVGIGVGGKVGFGVGCGTYNQAAKVRN